jgi:sugar/nucleoside kinase (ribokinase family)
MFSWFRQFGRHKRVLTIGSVHLDTIADRNFDEPSPPLPHATGHIIHSIGGNAFNIAVHLASHPKRETIKAVAVYTILPEHSFLTELILYKLGSAHIDTSYVRKYTKFAGKLVKGGGYVGIVDQQDREIRWAVVDAALYSVDIFSQPEEVEHLESAIAWADILVSDADLTPTTLNHICDLARDNSKPIFLIFGSEDNALKSWLAPNSNKNNIAACVAGRSQIIANLLKSAQVPDRQIQAFEEYVKMGDESLQFDIGQICAALKTQNVLCTHVQSAEGFAVLAARESGPQRFFHSVTKDVKQKVQSNATGIVDAALSGFIKSYVTLAPKRDVKLERFDLRNEQTQTNLSANIDDYVGHVISSEGATPGSVISFEEDPRAQAGFAKFLRLTGIALDVFPVFKYVLSIVALIVAYQLLDSLVDVLHAFGIDISWLDKKWIAILLRRR